MKHLTMLIAAFLLSTAAHANIPESCRRVFDSELKILGIKPLSQISLTRDVDYRESRIVVTYPTNIVASIAKGAVANRYFIEIKKNDITGGQETKLIALVDKVGSCAISYIRISSLALGTSAVNGDACFRLTAAKDLSFFLRPGGSEWRPLNLETVASHMELPMAHMCSNYYSPSKQLNMFE